MPSRLISPNIPSVILQIPCQNISDKIVLKFVLVSVDFMEHKYVTLLISISRVVDIENILGKILAHEIENR